MDKKQIQLQLEKERDLMLNDFQKQKERIQKENEVSITASKFVRQVMDNEQGLKRQTVGLVQLEDFLRIKQSIDDQQGVKEEDEKRAEERYFCFLKKV
jgi:hypothetical protein